MLLASGIRANLTPTLPCESLHILILISFKTSLPILVFYISPLFSSFIIKFEKLEIEMSHIGMNNLAPRAGTIGSAETKTVSAATIPKISTEED